MQKLILLIDDNKEEFKVLIQTIQLAGQSHICMWAGNIPHAERLLQQMLPDMILINNDMPATNSIACVEMIRKMKNLRQVPVAIYSNHFNELSLQKAEEHHAFCVQKPDSLLNLVQYLMKFCGENKALHSLH
jgi:CheY-like chemotaxis protein